MKTPLFMKITPKADGRLKRLRHYFIGAARRWLDTNKPDLNGKTAEEKLQTAIQMLMPVMPYILFPPSLSLVSSKDKLAFDYDVNKAADIVREAIEQEPDNLTAHHLLSTCLYFQGHAQEAKEVWEVLTTRNPDDPRCLMGLAKAHNQLLDFLEARRLLEKALTLPCDEETRRHIKAEKDHIIDTIESTAHLSL